MSYSTKQKNRDVIRELNLGPLMAISERRFKRQQEALKAQKEGKVIEAVEEDDDEGRLIQPVNLEFNAHDIRVSKQKRNIIRKRYLQQKLHYRQVSL